MHSQLLVLALSVALAFSAVVPKEAVKIIAKTQWNKAIESLKPELISMAEANGNFGYAIDTIASVSQANFNCIKSYGYNLAFLRIYGPDYNGQGDATGANNIYYATNAGLAYEVFVTPSTSGQKSGYTQFTEALSYAKTQGLKLNRVWLQVTSPINWGGNSYTNVGFINNFISAASSNGIQVGIYTNWYDWSQITGSASSISPAPYALWYWSVNGVGKNGETATNAQDFVPFGPFNSAYIKQFGVGENFCSTNVNVNIYPSSTNMKPNTVDASMRNVAPAA